MTIGRLAIRGVAFYRRTYAAVALGVATAVAVIAGAVLIGHSVRDSLADVAAGRIGNTGLIVITERPFTTTWCDRLVAQLPQRHAQCVALLALPATVEHETSRLRASNVQVLGIDRRFFVFHGVNHGLPDAERVMLSADLADEVGTAENDALLIRVQRLADIPADSLHARKHEGAKAIRAQFQSVLERSALGEFSPTPTQGPVRTVFVPLDRLQRELEQDGRANLMLLAGTLTETELRQALQSTATPADLGLRVVPIESTVIVESSAGLVPDAVAQAIESVAARTQLQSTPVLTWLANRMTIGDRSVPYSLVTAIGERAAGDATLSKLLAASSSGEPPIVLTDWAAHDLRAVAGERLDLEYFQWTDEGQLLTRRHMFRVAGVVPMTGLAIDRRLAPDYPGITDTNSLLDWDPPFPINLRLVRPIDDEYWRKFRTAPKAFISIDIGQQLWQTRHGRLTSLRLTNAERSDSAAAVAQLTEQVPRELDPVRAGFNVVDVRRQNREASVGATDFAMYFAAFSFFLMISSLVLTTLFFRLSLEHRLSQIGVLRALGYSISDIRRLFLLEGLAVSAIGSVLGIVLAIGWAALMMYGLRTWWVDAVGTTLLRVHLDPAALVIGAATAIVASVVSLSVAARSVGRASPRELLSGTREIQLAKSTRVSSFVGLSAIVAAITLSALTAARILPAEAGFFGAGTALLVAGLAALRRWLGRSPRDARDRLPSRFIGLALRNAAWRPGRSLTAAGLMAAAVFLIVSIDSFRRNEGDSGAPASGTGGFSLIGEASVPFVHDPGSAEGREALGLTGTIGGVSLEGATFVPLRLRTGDDASCLNLYQPRRPRVVGVPDRFIEANRFSFNQSLASTDAERANPWTLLKTAANDDSVPAIVDSTSLQYALHASVGDVIEIDRDTARPVRLRIVGSLSNSMLQSELLVAESAFLRLFPEVSGYRILLIERAGLKAGPTIDTRSGRPDLAAAIEEQLEPFGIDVQDAAQRLAAYHRVENTYLSTFQALGGLGLLLGSFGLAAVSSRNILERRKELALLGAAGFTGRHLQTIVLIEHLAVLAAGLAIGVIAALVAIGPVLIERGSVVHVTPFLWVLSVVATGFGVIAWTTRTVRRMPLVESLRTE